MWVVYALLSAVFASLVAILAKIGIKDVDSDLATAIRTVVIVVMAWVIVFAKGTASAISQVSRHSMIFILLSGAATGLSWLFYFKALQAGKVSQVAPIDKLSIALTLVLSFLLLGEQITIKTGIGAGLIVAGVAVLVFA